MMLLQRVKQARFRSQIIRRPLVRVRYTGLTQADAFLVSYPRSGTTWLRFLLAQILTEQATEFGRVRRFVPYVGSHRSAEAVLPSGGRIVATHEPFCNGIRKTIYIVRDPRAVCVSEFKWLRRRGLFTWGLEDFVDRFVTGRTNPWGRWDRHANYWTRRFADKPHLLHLIKFEDLRAETFAELRHVMRFLNADRPRDVVQKAIDDNSLAAMRAKEDRAPLSALENPVAPDIRFISEGALTGWRKDLSASQSQRICDAFANMMKSLGYL